MRREYFAGVVEEDEAVDVEADGGVVGAVLAAAGLPAGREVFGTEADAHVAGEQRVPVEFGFDLEVDEGRVVLDALKTADVLREESVPSSRAAAALRSLRVRSGRRCRPRA